MNEQGAFLAALLDSSRKAYAAGAVLRFQEAGGPAAKHVERLGFQALVEDTGVRLRHLAESLACGRPELFALDAAWLSATFAARGVAAELVGTMLSSLRAELTDALPADAAPLVATHFDAAQAGLPAVAVPPPSLLEEEAPHVDLTRRFVLALLEGDRARAERVVLDALEAGLDVEDLHRHVIGRAQAEIGRMWQAGEAHVAEEHFGSRVVEDVLALVRARTATEPPPATNGRTVLTASVAGNLHDIGARIVAQQFERAGWRSIFLGADVPTADLVQASQDFQPDLVALSVGLAMSVRRTADTVAALHADRAGLPVLVGGRLFGLIQDLWRDVGADGYAPDARGAVRLGAELVERAG